MTPLTGEALEKRIAELEQERDELLRTTENIRLSRNVTVHGKIKNRYGTKIGCLRKYGVESCRLVQSVIDKSKQTNIERYGYAQGPLERQQATKKLLYGNIFGPKDKCEATNIARYGARSGNPQKAVATKLERYDNGVCSAETMQKTVAAKIAKYGNAIGPIDKIHATKRERYGNAGPGNIAKSIATKRERYGNGFGDIAKCVATKRERYGNGFGDMSKVSETCMQRYGVPWHCMTTKCRTAQGKVISKANKWWHDKLLQELGIACDFDAVNIENRSYDLSYVNDCCKLLIEVNPTITHNSTSSYIYLVGKVKDNCPTGIHYHFDKAQLALKHGYTCITIFEWMTTKSLTPLESILQVNK